MRSIKKNQGDDKYARSTCLIFSVAISLLSIEAVVNGISGGLCQRAFRWSALDPFIIFWAFAPIAWAVLVVATFLVYLISCSWRRSTRNSVVALCVLFGVPLSLFLYLYFILPNPNASGCF